MSTIELPPLRSQSEVRPSLPRDAWQRLAQEFAEPVERMLPLLRRVERMVMPVWPLQDYVAVNPWAGMASDRFLEARSKLREVSDCELLMPLAYYQEEFRRGSFTCADVEAALVEWRGQLTAGKDDTALPDRVAAEVWRALDRHLPGQRDEVTGEAGSRAAEGRLASSRRLRTIAELADPMSTWNWSEWLQGELTKFCAGYFDRGQAIWRAADRQQSIWSAWRQQARHDRNPAWWGLSEVQTLAAELPADETLAIAVLVELLKVPEHWQERFLCCQVLAMPGWFAWARREGGWAAAGEDCNRVFAGLLAIRLVYEVALAQSLNLGLDWHTLAGSVEGDRGMSGQSPDGAEVRAILLRASELSFRRRLLDCVRSNSASVAVPPERPLAQLVFCIDVRSERIRRNLEALAPSLQTFGFAGFFGMPFEYRRLGSSLEVGGEAQLPVLLQPQFAVQEEFCEAVVEQQAAFDSLESSRFWRTAWKRFQGSLASCFPSVETTGWAGAWLMLSRSWSSLRSSSALEVAADLPGLTRDSLGPSLRGLNAQGWSTSRLVDLAEGMLRNLGLVDNFSRLVVLCGHRCEVENNPLRAGLDCGACGGHSGEANARFAALLLNQEFVRRDLVERGIVIPGDTWFLAAVHQTTSDEVEFPGSDATPFSHAKEVARLRELCRQAGELVARERGASEGLGTLEAVRRRAVDWSEVRPEWGLVGNAALVAGPRAMTRGSNLDGRVFLHEYDHRLDPQGKVLELILTAPLIVASWINLQYYASTVDPQSYGSGCKTIHNVVGKFGLLAGSASDLQVGLPWQSVGVGAELRHSPLRLQALIAAPRTQIERVVASHSQLSDLLQGGWIHLCAWEQDRCWQWQANGSWRELELDSDNCSQVMGV